MKPETDKKVSWRKAKRMPILKFAMLLILIGFVIGYWGGTIQNAAMIYAGLLLWGVAAVAVIIIKK